MKQKVTVSIDQRLLDELDRMEFESRSAGMEAALEVLFDEAREASFERNVRLLDPLEEQADAELGMADYADHVLGADA
jgi:hypothetical protein